jgi:hypothetical protein
MAPKRYGPKALGVERDNPPAAGAKRRKADRPPKPHGAKAEADDEVRARA